MLDAWRSRWIWHAAAPGGDAYVYFRGHVELDAHPQLAQLFISASSRYQLFVNGTWLGRGPDRADPSWQYYDAYDLAGHLVAGTNVIAALVWNAGRMARNRAWSAARGGLIADLRMEMPDGRVRNEGTNASWRCEVATAWTTGGAPITNWGVGFREFFDPSAMPAGWTEVDFDDSDWTQAEVLGAPPCQPFTRLLPREIPPLATREVHPITVVGEELNRGEITAAAACLRDDGNATVIDACRPGACPRLVLDFGREVSGYLNIELETDAQDGWLVLWYGETLDLKRLDALRMRPGVLRWGPFGRRTCRYLGLSVMGADAPVELQQVMLRAVGYPFGAPTAFRCSDVFLNAIRQASVDTLQVTAQDHFENTPVREQALSLSDLRVQGRAAAFAFGDTRLTAKCLRQMSRLQGQDGLFTGLGPVDNERRMPDGCLWWLLALADYWQHSADDHLVAELFVPAMRVVSAFERELARNGLVGQCDRREWRTQLYPEGRFTCDCDVPLNLLLKMALDAAGGLARALGRKTEADRWARLGTRLRDALRSKAFDAEHQLFIDVVPDPGCRDLAFSEFTNALAVLSGVAEDPTALMQRALAEEAVLPPLSPLHASSIVEALFTAGQDEAATNALRDYWGEMMARDATTFWEYFDLDTPRCAIPLSPEDPFLVAHCRGWSVGPAALLARNLLGVRPAQPGFAAVEVAPSPGGLDAAEGTVQTPQGPVEVKWMREGGRIAVDVALPRELPLTVSLPAAAEGVAVRVGEQTVLARDGQQTLPAHVRACERMNGRVRLQLESTRGGRFEAEA